MYTTIDIIAIRVILMTILFVTDQDLILTRFLLSCSTLQARTALCSVRPTLSLILRAPRVRDSRPARRRPTLVASGKRRHRQPLPSIPAPSRYPQETYLPATRQWLPPGLTGWHLRSTSRVARPGLHDRCARLLVYFATTNVYLSVLSLYHCLFSNSLHF